MKTAFAALLLATTIIGSAQANEARHNDAPVRSAVPQKSEAGIPGGFGQSVGFLRNPAGTQATANDAARGADQGK